VNINSKNNIDRYEFICVGPTKTGTTWLSYVFRELEISLPPAKEIKYFNEEGFRLKESGFFDRLRGKHWIFKANRAYLFGIIRNTFSRIIKLQDPCFCRLSWSLKFVFGVRSDNWYRSLFKEYGGIGDISPRYAELNENLIKDINYRFPGIRIILIVRNPIERAWSSAKMDLCKHKNRIVSDIKVSEFIEYLSLPQVMAQSSYCEMILKWQKTFEDRFKVIFYDDISFNPISAIHQILQHLHVSDQTIEKKLIDKSYLFEKKIGEGVKGEMPESIQRFLEEMYSHEILKLKEFYPDTKWPSLWEGKMKYVK
jgi:hypothetical protein